MLFYPTMALRRLSAALIGCALGTAVLAVPAWAQSAAVQYQRLIDRENAVRVAAAPSIATLRTLAQGYEAIVRSSPRSGYADNALGQAAGLLQWAFERGGSPADRDRAIRLLRQLSRSYPSSSLVKDVEPRVRALAANAAATSATKTGTAGSAPTIRPATEAPKALPQPADSVPAAAEHKTTEARIPVPSPAAAELRLVSYARLPKGDRLILEFSEERPFVSRRTAKPDQLLFDFSASAVAPDTILSTNAIQGPLARTVRLGARPTGGVQLSIDLAGTPRFSAFPLYEPYRLVIDIETDGALPELSATTPALPNPGAAAPGAANPLLAAAVSRIAAANASRNKPAPSPGAAPAVPAASAAPAPSAPSAARGTPSTPSPAPALKPPAAVTAKPTAPASTSVGDYSLARQLGLGIARVVIDPGHGGHDPGAQAHGVSESELVLDVALRAEQLLKDQPGFDVVLTRRTNEFIALEERTAIANREGADLFLSIHANASPQTDTRGVETYFLSFSRTPQAEAVAARENASNVQTMAIMPELVKAIALNNKVAESRELAGMVQASLVRRLKAQNQAAKDLGVKQAPFVVLIGAQMPSVLAEISFLTNRAEASLLKQAAYRQRIAQALADAVLKYQASLKKVSTTATLNRD